MVPEIVNVCAGDKPGHYIVWVDRGDGVVNAMTVVATSRAAGYFNDK